jgi:hypothetical protein
MLINVLFPDEPIIDPHHSPAMSDLRTHNWFPEITTAAQLRAMRKPQLSEILYRTGHSRNARASKELLVGMCCRVLKIYA